MEKEITLRFINAIIRISKDSKVIPPDYYFTLDDQVQKKYATTKLDLEELESLAEAINFMIQPKGGKI